MFSANPIIFDEFLANTQVVVLLRLVKLTQLPTEGLAGNVNVKLAVNT
jgi:hypothetical protein